MAKPDPQLLDPARYPYRREFTTRFQDVDPNRHINNVAFTALFEDLRVRFDYDIGLAEQVIGRGLRTMIASLGIEYLGEAFYPEPVIGFAGGLSRGRTSWTVGGILTQGSSTCAFMRATLVCVDGVRPTAIPDEFRASLEHNMIRMDAPVP
ncbi:MAG: thioesterase family protein [Novosphingobium sp.]|nr:thioesterase family protein [Novosphingobium sp.]